MNEQHIETVIVIILFTDSTICIIYRDHSFLMSDLSTWQVFAGSTIGLLTRWHPLASYQPPPPTKYASKAKLSSLKMKDADDDGEPDAAFPIGSRVWGVPKEGEINGIQHVHWTEARGGRVMFHLALELVRS